MSSFNENLRLLRKKNNMTQADLAKRLGVSSSAVAMYERGEREPNIKTLKSIGSFFNVDMNFLLGMDNDGECYSNVAKEDAEECMREASPVYYINEDTKFLFENPEYKILFDTMKNIKKEDVEFVKKMIEKIK